TLRLDMPMPVLNAALTVRDSAEVLAGGMVSGADTPLAAWALVPSCTGAPAPAAGVAAPDTTHVCDGTCGAAAGNIIGAPRMLADSLASDSMRYLLYGGPPRRALTARADVVLPPNANVTPGPAVNAGVCQLGAPTNW